MKKFMWIMALLAALALIITGCPGSGDPDDGKDEDEVATNVYFAADGGDNEGFTKIQDGNTALTITEDYIRVFFDPPGDDFKKLRVKFTLSEAYDVGTNGAYHLVDEDVDYVGASNNGYHYLDNSAEITFEENPDDFYPGIDKKNMRGICLVISDWEVGTTITINNVTFVGIGKSSEPIPPPPEAPFDEEDGEIRVYFGVSDTAPVTATVKGTGYQKGENGTLTVAWDNNDDTGAFRAEVEIATADQKNLSSGYSKFGMEWTSGSADGGNFNISLYFPGNRMLSAYAASGSATFDFNSDHPDWAAGTTWGGAAVGTITGFEIWSGDKANFGSDDLVITKIWFE